MWFKSLNLFRIYDLEINDEDLNKRLENHAFEPCRPQEEVKSGWVSPFGDEYDYMAPSTLGCYLICLKVETRKVPTSTINEMAEREIAKLKKEDPEAKITGATKKRIKEDIKLELQPRAFSKFEKIYGYIDTNLGYLVIDVASRSKGEDFAAALRHVFPERGLKVLPVQTIHEPSVSMTNWLTTGQNPANLIPLETVTIRDIDEVGGKGSIKYTKQDLDDDRLKGYLGERKTVSALDVEFEERVSLTLTEDFLIKSVKWGDELKDIANDQASEEESLQGVIMSDFTIMQDEVKSLVGYLIDSCLGGEQLVDEDTEKDDEDEGQD